MIGFSVYGVPAPQGSKTIARAGDKVWLRDDNRKTQPWRSALVAAAVAAMGDQQPLAGPVRLDVTFVFPRLRSHFRTGKRQRELRDNAPNRCPKRPDLDKLLRAVGDSLSGVAFRDDAQIVELIARKHYGIPGAHITISEVAP